MRRKINIDRNSTIHTEDYREILLRRLFHGKGGTYLVNNDGIVLIDSSNTVAEKPLLIEDTIVSINLFCSVIARFSCAVVCSLSSVICIIF